ncbi:hypothetical protein MUK42_01497 [Musa troglodytarum]|uniref:DUF7795 domain-containing protein n=1 Tax=Musa troglodytarum TaxID=320322 RepID=A0A9E7JVM4_9LILI|nr:hypothetical protein MUK42_01497 [Musa troglodytarum]
MASTGTIAVSGATDDPVLKRKYELEKIHCELGGNITRLFLDFMTKTAKYEELVDVGKRFLIGFHGSIGLAQATDLFGSWFWSVFMWGGWFGGGEEDEEEEERRKDRTRGGKKGEEESACHGGEQKGDGIGWVMRSELIKTKTELDLSHGSSPLSGPNQWSSTPNVDCLKLSSPQLRISAEAQIYMYHMTCTSSEKFRSSEFQKTSENVAVTIGANWNERMKAYVEAGYRHNQQSVQNISNLHICVQGLQDHLKKVETLLGELVCLMEDAIVVTQAANQRITALLDDTPSEEMLCLVLSFEEETKHIHLQDTSISQVIIMRVISHMLKLDCDMQKNIVRALNLKTSSPELESYCLMWDLHPYVNDDVMHLAWRLVPHQDQRFCH